MEREDIKTIPPSLPEIEVGRIPDDGEVWECDDGGAHLQMTRHRLATEAVFLSFFSLSVSGSPDERSRIIHEFNEVYGEPFARETMTGHPRPIDIAGYYLTEGES